MTVIFIECKINKFPSTVKRDEIWSHFWWANYLLHKILTVQQFSNDSKVVFEFYFVTELRWHFISMVVKIELFRCWGAFFVALYFTINRPRWILSLQGRAMYAEILNRTCIRILITKNIIITISLCMICKIHFLPQQWQNMELLRCFHCRRGQQHWRVLR